MILNFQNELEGAVAGCCAHDWFKLRVTLINYFSQRRIRISSLLRSGFQGDDGRIIMGVNGWPAATGRMRVGHGMFYGNCSTPAVEFNLPVCSQSVWRYREEGENCDLGRGLMVSADKAAIKSKEKVDKIIEPPKIPDAFDEELVAVVELDALADFIGIPEIVARPENQISEKEPTKSPDPELVIEASVEKHQYEFFKEPLQEPKKNLTGDDILEMMDNL